MDADLSVSEAAYDFFVLFAVADWKGMPSPNVFWDTIHYAWEET